MRVTRSALSYLEAFTPAQGADGAPRFRLERNDQRECPYRLTRGAAADGDRVVEAEGRPLLALAESVADDLGEGILVAQAGPRGPELVVNVPQPYPFGPVSHPVACDLP